MRMVGRFYVAAVKAVLLFGSEAWVLTPRLEKSSEGFHLQVVRRMAGMGTKRHRDGTCLYTTIREALEMVGMEKIRVYTIRFQKKGTQYIETRPIMDLCLSEERNTGLRLSMQWWYQPALDILGIRAVQAATEGKEDTGPEEYDG